MFNHPYNDSTAPDQHRNTPTHTQTHTTQYRERREEGGQSCVYIENASSLSLWLFPAAGINYPSTCFCCYFSSSMKSLFLSIDSSSSPPPPSPVQHTHKDLIRYLVPQTLSTIVFRLASQNFAAGHFDGTLYTDTEPIYTSSACWIEIRPDRSGMLLQMDRIRWARVAADSVVSHSHGD